MNLSQRTVSLAADMKAAKKLLSAAPVALTIFGLAISGVARAAPEEPASAAGNAQATVVEQISVAGDQDLRFGMIVSPSSDGSLTIDAAGTIVASAGMSGATDLSQNGTTRGPASFDLQGSPDRLVYIQLPSFADLSGPGGTMRVDGLNSNQTSTTVKLDNNGYFKLLIGGRLNVSGGQPVGIYTGSFEVSVLYE